MSILFIIACAICAILAAMLVAEYRKENKTAKELAEVRKKMSETVERTTDLLKDAKANLEVASSGFSRVIAKEYVRKDSLTHVFDGDLQKQIHKRLASKIGYAILRSYPDKVVLDKDGLPVYAVAFYVKPAKVDEE